VSRHRRFGELQNAAGGSIEETPIDPKQKPRAGGTPNALEGQTALIQPNSMWIAELMISRDWGGEHAFPRDPSLSI
jgi:hypothetical protein